MSAPETIGSIWGGSRWIHDSPHQEFIRSSRSGNTLWRQNDHLRQIIKNQESTFTLDTIDDQSLAKENPVICIELRQKELAPHNQQPMVRIGAIVAVPSDRRLGAFQRIGFARYERLAIDLSMTKFVIV